MNEIESAYAERKKQKGAELFVGRTSRRVQVQTNNSARTSAE